MSQETGLEAAIPAGAPASRNCTVLVVGADDWAIEQAAAELEAGGNRVLRCHERGEPAFPCNAMIEGRDCPLDDGFEVVADVRSRAAAGLSQSELGSSAVPELAGPRWWRGSASSRPCNVGSVVLFRHVGIWSLSVRKWPPARVAG